MAINLRIVCNAQQDLSYFYTRKCCPFLNHVAHLLGQLTNACLEHQGIAFHCSNTKLGFEVLNKRLSLNGAVAACLIR